MPQYVQDRTVNYFYCTSLAVNNIIQVFFYSTARFLIFANFIAFAFDSDRAGGIR